jgi:hypothetical protein
MRASRQMTRKQVRESVACSRVCGGYAIARYQSIGHWSNTLVQRCNGSRSSPRHGLQLNTGVADANARKARSWPSARAMLRCFACH